MTISFLSTDRIQRLSDVLGPGWSVYNRRFLANNDLGYVTQRLTELCAMSIDKELSADDLDQLLVGKVAEVLDSPEGRDVADTLAKITLTMAEKFRSSFALLRNRIAPEVTSLTNEIVELTDRFITATTGVDALSGALVDTGSTLAVMNWQQITIPGPIEATIGNLHQLANVKTETASINSVGYITDRIGQVEDIPLSAEAYQAMRELALREKGTALDQTELDQALCMVTVASSFRGAMLGNFSKEAMSRPRGQVVCTAATYLTTQYQTIRQLRDVSFELNEADKAKLLRNFEVCDRLGMLLAYYLHVCRKLMADKLVLTQEVINEDQLKSFQVANGTQQDIANVLRTYYNANSKDLLSASVLAVLLPEQGLTTSEVLSLKDRARAHMEKIVLELKGRMQVIRSAAQTDAYKQVLDRYIRNLDDGVLPDGVSKEQFVPRARAHIAGTVPLLNRRDGSVEDALYEFMLRSFYSNHMVNTIYHKLGAEYVKLLSEKESLSEEDLALTDAYVMADILVEFLVTNFIE